MSRRKRNDDPINIELQLGREQGAVISCVAPSEANGYLWIGSYGGGCFGTVADKDLKRLRDLCDGILQARKKDRRP